MNNLEIYFKFDKENNYFSLEITGDEKTDILDSNSNNETIKSVLDIITIEYKIRRDDLQALLCAGNRLIREK